MNRQTIAKLVLYFLIGAIVAGYAWIRVDNSQYIREPRATFGDTHEFLGAAATPVLSKSFWISLRPPVVPLFYKLVGDNYQHLSTFQLWFSIFSWCALGLVITSIPKPHILKLISLSVILAFSLSEEIIMWDYIILGDSISISIMVLFFSSAIILLAKWNILRLSFLLFMALLFAFVRDDFAYYLLMLAGVSFVLIVRTKHWHRPLLISAIFVVIFFVSNILSSTSLRWYRPLLNTISLRILPNSEYVSYFEAHGMPINAALMERSGKPLHADYNALVDDPRLDEFRNWIQIHGKNEYIKFLWFFKTDTFQNIFNDIDHLFAPNVFYYTATRFRPILADSRLDEFLFPIRYGFLLFIFANSIAAAVAVIGFYERKITWTLPLAMILLTYPQAILVWNADANDMARHALYHNIMLRMGVWIMIIFAIDYLILVIKQKYQLLQS